VILYPWYRPPDISRDNVDVQTGDAFGALVQPSALSMLAAAPEASRANPGVFKSILINFNASKVLSYLTSRNDSIYEWTSYMVRSMMGSLWRCIYDVGIIFATRII